MDRKATAKETLRIMEQGYYEYDGRRVEIAEAHRTSVEKSFLVPSGGWERMQGVLHAGTAPTERPEILLQNCSAVRAVMDLANQGVKNVGVLNFASAKNPGGGFLNGAMAQEESLAASGGLYETLTAHPEYYERNRACGNMTYTDNAIYSPDVVFFRDERFNLTGQPVTASVLTLPAVNLGQVRLKGEDLSQAKKAMKERMRLALRIFAAQGDTTLVLGAYGCGVFRNDPADVAVWWQMLLSEPEFNFRFHRVLMAVYDNSKNQACWNAFDQMFGNGPEGQG